MNALISRFNCFNCLFYIKNKFRFNEIYTVGYINCMGPLIVLRLREDAHIYTLFISGRTTKKGGGPP